MASDELCGLPLPAVPRGDWEASGLSPRIQAQMIAFLRSGEIPPATRSLKDPEYLAQLIRTGAVTLSPETLVEIGAVSLPDSHEALAATLKGVVKRGELRRIRDFMQERPDAGMAEMVNEDLLSLDAAAELIVGLFAATGGLAVVNNDECTAEERARLRQRNSDAITDWARAEDATITANFENGQDGLTRFVEYLGRCRQSVESGIGAAASGGAEALLWVFGVSIPLSSVVIGLIAATISGAAGGSVANDRVLEGGLRGLERARDAARKSLEARVGELRNAVIAAGNSCPRLRILLLQNQNLPRTSATSGDIVYLRLLVAWGQQRYGHWLTPPNPLRNPPEDRKKWVLYGGHTDWPYIWDGFDLVEEINRLQALVSGN